MAEIDLKNQVFANNPALYKALYEQPESPLADEEAHPEWFVPQNETEIQDILEELKNLGLG